MALSSQHVLQKSLSETVISFSKEVESSKAKTHPQIPSTVWIVGSMMCLINVSCVMVYGLSAIYLKSILGVTIGWIGLLEGVAEGASFAMKLFSGMISDYFKRRKFIIVIGYAMMVFSKPILALSSTCSIAFSARLMERLGNGAQATARDALISDVAPAGIKGTCFGLKRSLGTAGSFLGGVFAVLAMMATNDNFHLVFWLAMIPAILALGIATLILKEPPQNLEAIDKKQRRPIRLSDLPLLGKSFWLLMCVVALFMMARVGEAFLVLHASQNFGLPNTYAPMIIILYNATYSLSSYPVGKLADQFNRHYLLALGIGVLIAADLVLAAANSLGSIIFGVILWGIQMGAVQSVFMAMIADTTPKGLKGTGFGFFYLVSAIASVVAGACAGVIAQAYGEAAAFVGSFVLASFSLLLLFILKSNIKVNFTPPLSLESRNKF